MRTFTFPAAITCLMLGACGGSGSGGPAVTPPPPPPPTNASLTNLQYSQSFTNDAASATVALDLVTKTGITGTAKAGSLTVTYDATTKGYTVAVAGRSQTFGQVDVKTNDLNEATYQKSDGANRDYLTLLKTPYSGTSQTQYAALGYWQHNTLSTNRQDTEFSVFTYGIPTPSASVPKVGTAAFSVDAFGFASAPGKEPLSFTGRGSFSVDFGAGIFSTHTYLSEASLVSQNGTVGGGIELTAGGHLSASSGGFSGDALYEGSLGYAGGVLAGRFYGPNSEELGATFAGSNASGLSVAGGFTGQRDPNAQPENLTLTNLTHQQLFYTQWGYNQIGSLNWQNAETFTIGTPESDLYGGQFTINDKVASTDPNFTAYQKTFSSTSDSQAVTLELYKPGSGNTELALTYASFGHWSTAVPNGGGTHPLNLWFAYGLETPARLLFGKTGTAHYDGILNGTNSNSSGVVLYAVKGSSRFDVDFGAQSYSGALTMIGTSKADGSKLDFGSFDFAAKLGSYVANSSASITQNGQQVGRLDTKFYGPDGEEIAGPFSVNIPPDKPGGSTSIIGAVAAKR